MSYYYPLSIPINSLTHKALGDLAKIIQSKSLQQYSNHEKRYGKEELYRQWLKNTISDASSKIESFIKLFKQILLIGGFQKGILNEASLQGLNLYIKMFIETCINSFKMENEYLAFTKILDNLRQTEQFAWKQYQYASKDQFRKIKQDNLLLIKYFSSLKFNQAPSIKNGELDEKGSIKNILDFLLKLQANGYSSVLLKQISKIKDQNVKQSLQDFAKYYESYCINILKKDTTFFYFLQQLQKDQRNPQDIERIFKRLDKKVQSTFIKLKEGFIKLLSKDRIPQRDNYERVKQLQELVKRKDEQLNKLRNKPYQGNKVMSKDKIFNTPLSSPSKKDLSDIEVLLEQKRTLEAQLSFMKQENEDLRRLKRELEEFKNRQIKNNPQNVIKANYQTPGRNQKMEQRVIRVNNPANQKKQQRHSEELKNNLHKLSQYENSMKKMQVQINRLNTINEDKLKQINYLNSQLATHQKNIQKYKREKEELKQSLEKLSVKQKIPQTRNRQFDQLLQKLNTSERKNNQYRDQITALEQKFKRQQQNSSQQIDRINNEWKKKVSFQKQLQNGANKRDVLISQKSRLIQKMSIQLNQLVQSLAAASQTEGRLREQIRYYTQQLQIHQKRIQSISNQVNISPRIQGRHRQQSNKQWQNIYQQKLNKLIQLNKKSLFQKQEKIIMLHSRINQLEAYNDQLKGDRFRDYNNSPRK